MVSNDEAAHVLGAVGAVVRPMTDPIRELTIPPDCDAVAAAVSREHPDWSPSRRLSEAMKRTKGSANPRTMAAALLAYDSR